MVQWVYDPLLKDGLVPLSSNGGSGTVTSVDVSGGSTGLTASGGPVTVSGVITLAGTLNIASGGTGQTTANDALNALLPSQTGNTGYTFQTDGTNTSWQPASAAGVTSLNSQTGLVTLANAMGLSWTNSGGVITPVFGNMVVTSVTTSGNGSFATVAGTNIGSPTLADASTQPLILSGGASPTAGNLVGLAIEKSGFEEVFLGVNKNSATGQFAANSMYLTTYTASGKWGVGRGNGAALPDKADVQGDGSGNVDIPNGNLTQASVPVVTTTSTQTLTNKNLTSATNTFPANLKTRSIGITIDGGGSVITTGNKGYIYVPYGCTITAATMVADQSGSAVVDVWSSAYPTVPTVSNTITASDLPTLSSSQVSQDTTLTGWTKTIAAGSVIGFNVNSAATVTRVNLTLTVQTT